MAITLVEGFKYVPNAAARYGPTNSTSGTTTWNRQIGRSSDTFAISATNSTTTDTANQAGRIRMPVNPAVFSLGFSMYHRFVTASAYNIVGAILWSGGQTAPAFSMAAGQGVGNSFSSYNGMSSIVVNDGSMTTLGWHWWNIVYFAHGSTGYFRVYRDGVLCWSISGSTIAVTGLPSYLDLYIGNCNAPSGVYVGDLVIRNDATAIPDTRVDVLVPTSDSTAGWTRSSGATNYSLVDDPGPTIDTSDYVTANAGSVTDTYGLSELPVTPSLISAVGVHAIGGKDAGGSRALAVMVNSAEGSPIDPGTYAPTYHYWETNPVGGAAWTKTEVDSMTAGIRTKT